MSTLLLRLAGPLQAWGVDSKFDVRASGREPSKSAVIGLLAAALGLPRDADLSRLCALRFGVRVDREGTLLRDFHIAHPANNKDPYVSYRYYLCDAVFLVGLESDDLVFLNELEDALRHPVFPLFLGRRSCPPTLPLVLGVREATLADALRDEPLRDKRRKDEKLQGLRLITDADADDPRAVAVRDKPVSFSPYKREFAFRSVVEYGFVIPAEEPETEHDPMAELR